jgi:hypothetical protein
LQTSGSNYTNSVRFARRGSVWEAEGVTVELPESIARRAEEKAAELGVPLPQFVAEALEEKLGPTGPLPGRELAKHGGGLRHLSEDLRMIEREVEEAFEQIEPET